MSPSAFGFVRMNCSSSLRVGSCASLTLQVEDNLEFYFQACSMTLDVRSAASLAATLAAGGLSPFSAKRYGRGSRGDTWGIHCRKNPRDAFQYQRRLVFAQLFLYSCSAMGTGVTPLRRCCTHARS